MADKSDPTGIVATLDDIDETALSPRHQRIAAGLALIREHGHSIASAARDSGIPYSTLHRYHEGLSTLGTESVVKRYEGAILAQATENALLGSERINERLLDPDHEWKDSDLVKATQAATQAVASKRRWSHASGGDADGGGMSALARMLQGHKMTLEPRNPADEAVDITPAGSSSTGDSDDSEAS